MTFIEKLFSTTAGNIINSGGKIIDNLVSTDVEKLDAKNKLGAIVMTHLAALKNSQRDVLVAEIKGNALQKNWRPIVMLAFAFIIVYHYFLQPLITYWWPIPVIELPDRFWSLLEIGMGGYVIGRSVEKVADKLTDKVDFSFVKRKNRKFNK
ncbi:MAG: holin family protein [Flavobacteriaceae bacterium]|nr:holin family protein [Flavobacteriaceae bacterium]